jgi:hypothetical protein
MIRNTHLTLDQVAERATALGWTVRPDTSPYGRPQLVVTRPPQWGYLVLTQLPRAVQWQSVRLRDDEAMRLVAQIEGMEVTA